MPRIELLDKETIDKIAAGEVVERPRSVVKELTENAIDAGARFIKVEIEEGGKDLVRITDDGCGIPKDQIEIAFGRHCTSKLRSAEDLESIVSLGFRGEALSSIGAVSKIELITRTADELYGSRYTADGGERVSLDECGFPEGTCICVRELFFNTPARRAFLKAPQTEAGQIGDLMEHMALSHPEIAFHFLSNGRTRLKTTGSADVRDLIFQIYGRDVALNLLRVGDGAPVGSSGLSIGGYIGSPSISRGNRNFENYFINGRYVKSDLISKAIEDSYRGFMMQHKYPFAVLYLDIDTHQVDVNVHPNKMEIRLLDEETIYFNIVRTLRKALNGEELIRRENLGKKAASHGESKESSETGEPGTEAAEGSNLDTWRRLRAEAREDAAFDSLYDADGYAGMKSAGKGADDSADDGTVSADYGRFLENGAEFVSSSEYEYGKVISNRADKSRKKSGASVLPTLCEYAKETGLDESARSFESAQRHIIGQLFDTYWLVEYRDRLYMIDQHAAHEKLLYEQMMEAHRNKELTSQALSPPAILSLSMREEVLLECHLADFERLGFVIEPFGGREYAVRAVPGNLYGIDPLPLLAEMIDGLSFPSIRETPEAVLEKIAGMSCKAAVKGNDPLTESEIEELFRRMPDLENPYFCPHGRPVIISLSKYEIEKKFGRIV